MHQLDLEYVFNVQEKINLSSVDVDDLLEPIDLNIFDPKINSSSIGFIHEMNFPVNNGSAMLCSWEFRETSLNQLQISDRNAIQFLNPNFKCDLAFSDMVLSDKTVSLPLNISLDYEKQILGKNEISICCANEISKDTTNASLIIERGLIPGTFILEFDNETLHRYDEFKSSFPSLNKVVVLKNNETLEVISGTFNSSLSTNSFYYFETKSEDGDTLNCTSDQTSRLESPPFSWICNVTFDNRFFIKVYATDEFGTTVSHKEAVTSYRNVSEMEVTCETEYDDLTVPKCSVKQSIFQTDTISRFKAIYKNYDQGVNLVDFLNDFELRFSTKLKKSVISS